MHSFQNNYIIKAWALVFVIWAYFTDSISWIPVEELMSSLQVGAGHKDKVIYFIFQHSKVFFGRRYEIRLVLLSYLRI